MAAKSRHLERQVERILDEAPEPQVEVIVQMESDRSKSSRLARAAGEALSRRRLSLTPRDLLPGEYRKRITPQEKQETTSTRTLLGRATAETLALAKIQQMGPRPTDSLLQSGIVRAALDRMLRPARRARRTKREPSRFWTSRSMPLRLERDELRRLTEEVDNIKSIHLNRHLSLPIILRPESSKSRQRRFWSRPGVSSRSKRYPVWGPYGARGKGITIGLLDTGVDASVARPSRRSDGIGLSLTSLGTRSLDPRRTTPMSMAHAAPARWLVQTPRGGSLAWRLRRSRQRRWYSMVGRGVPTLKSSPVSIGP